MSKIVGWCSAALLACVTFGVAQAGSVKGEVFYRERIALPPGAALIVRLQDVSRADAPAKTLAQQTISVGLRPIIPFTLDYPDSEIDQRSTYAVSAQIVSGGRLLFTSDRFHRAVTHGAPAIVRIPLAKVAAAAGGPDAVRDVALVGPIWVAEDIGGGGVIDRAQSRISFTAEGRASGNGGCNSFTGSYSVTGATLSIDRVAATMMACSPALMDQEQKFFAALTKVKGYRIERGLLLLVDGSGQPLIRLWARKS